MYLAWVTLLERRSGHGVQPWRAGAEQFKEKQAAMVMDQFKPMPLSNQNPSKSNATYRGCQ
jgi:hypothetical protein